MNQSFILFFTFRIKTIKIKQKYFLSKRKKKMAEFPTVEEFESRGWYLSKEGIEYIASENEGLKSIKDYIEVAKDVKRTFLIYSVK